LAKNNLEKNPGLKGVGVAHDWVLTLSMSFFFFFPMASTLTNEIINFWYISFDLSVEGFIGGWAFDSQIL